MSALRRRAALGVAGAFTLSGVVHFARPAVFRPLIPQQVPRPTEVVYASGALELVCAFGLVTRRKWAGPASAALLLAVWPGNLTHAQRITKKFGPKSWQAGVAWGRMPLQAPMIWAVLGPESAPTNCCS